MKNMMSVEPLTIYLENLRKVYSTQQRHQLMADVTNEMEDNHAFFCQFIREDYYVNEI
jgi:hypothetical protein